MTDNKFEKLIEKNSNIKEHICVIRDHLEEYEQEEDIGYLEDILHELEYIGEYTEDEIIRDDIEKIDINDPEKAVLGIEHILWYIAEYYQIDRNIIKHRRMELKNHFATRKVETLPYKMQDAYAGSYEYEAYIALLEFLPIVEEVSVKKQLLNSFFSSPQVCLKVLKGLKEHYKSPFYESLYSQLGKFEKAVEKDCKNIKQIIESGEDHNTRYTQIVDYIDQEVYDKKVIVFSQYTETAKLMQKILENQYTDDRTVCFYEGLDGETLIQNMDRFQNDPHTKILVCDYLAGEGRNLQYADLIIHLDLPLSPTQLEQRIGRLDRIGREPDHDILSVVIYATSSLEEDLYRLWDECLHIFKESVSGLEIALNSIEQVVSNYIINYDFLQLEDVIEGLKSDVENLKVQLREEHFYDANRQLSRYLHQIISQLIEKVDENEGQQLAIAMMAWAMMVGLASDTTEKIVGLSMARFTRRSFSAGSFLQAWYIPPSTGEILKRSPRKHELIGTFNRKYAVEHEDIAFFAPGEPMFDSLLEHAKKNYRGTCCAIGLAGPVTFEGFLITWRVSYNIEPILENGLSIMESDKVRVYQTNFVIKDLVRIDGDEDLTVEQVENSIETSRVEHLGKRSGVTDPIVEMATKYGSIEGWERIVRSSKNESFQQIKQEIETKLNRVSKNFIKGYKLNQYGIQRGRAYYENDMLPTIESRKRCNIIAQGIKESRIEVDSIVYVRMKNNDSI